MIKNVNSQPPRPTPHQTTKAQQKINKLKKVQIWPSVLFFLFSLLITFAAVLSITSIFLIIITEEKLDQGFQTTKYIESTIRNNMNRGDTYEEALEFLKQENQGYHAVAILDRQNRFLGQHGVMSFDLSREGTINITDEHKFYLDRSSGLSMLDSDGNMIKKIMTLVKKCFTMSTVGTADWLNNEINHEPYWLEALNQGDDYTVLVRNEFILTRKDVIYIFGIGIVTLAAICIPMLFLFIYVISSNIRQHKMMNLISMDTITGGHNWFYFENHANKEMNRRKNNDKIFAVMQLTYMKYKSFCSYHGGQEGNLLLQRINDFLAARLTKGELCAHCSEADFAILLHANSQEEVTDRVNKWFGELPALMNINHLSFHVGICMTDKKEETDDKKKKKRINTDISQLYHNAGIAKDTIPESEERAVLFFDDKMKTQQLWEHYVEDHMEMALQKQEFKVYLQPKYNPITGELSGAEALVRWFTEQDGMVAPYRFIPIFEKNGFITKLDDYMMAQVAMLQTRWISEGRKVVPVSVNVSRANFGRPDLAEHICALVDQYQLPHELFEIELTESAFFDDKEMLLRTVKALRSMGFLVSMDDFGAGYSSLNSLKELPLDILKLDADFFRGQYEEDRRNIVVSEAINLAKKLNMKIVAEGIEEKNQVDFLAGLGCDMIQGYFFAKPMPVEEYELKM